MLAFADSPKSISGDAVCYWVVAAIASLRLCCCCWRNNRSSIRASGKAQRATAQTGRKIAASAAGGNLALAISTWFLFSTSAALRLILALSFHFFSYNFLHMRAACDCIFAAADICCW